MVGRRRKLSGKKRVFSALATGASPPKSTPVPLRHPPPSPHVQTLRHLRLSPSLAPLCRPSPPNTFLAPTTSPRPTPPPTLLWDKSPLLTPKPLPGPDPYLIWPLQSVGPCSNLAPSTFIFQAPVEVSPSYALPALAPFSCSSLKPLVVLTGRQHQALKTSAQILQREDPLSDTNFTAPTCPNTHLPNTIQAPQKLPQGY